MKHVRPTLLAALALSVATVSAHAADPVTLTILTPGSGYPSATASSINASGDILGTSSPAYAFGVATVWHGGTSQALQPLSGYAISIGTSINDHGAAVGISQTGDGSYQQGSGAYQATRWNGSTPTVLQTLSGYSNSQATDINNGGTVVGSSVQANGASQATLWTGSTPSALANLAGYTSSSASHLNDAGQIVGVSRNDTSGQTQATLWSGGTVSALSNLAGYTSSSASDINSSGTIVGSSLSASGQYVATQWVGGVATALGATSSLNSSFAYGINASGLVVGMSGNSAVLWVNGNELNLNAFLSQSQIWNGWSLDQAISINDEGYIIGFARNGRFGGHGVFVLSPVPEPASWAAWMLGLAGVALAVRSSRKA